MASMTFGPTPVTDLAEHVGDEADAHDASAVSYDNTTSELTATDVQAALDEIVVALEA